MKSPEIGRSIERREDFRFLSGTSCFVDDIEVPGMLHATVVRSSVASSRLLGIDLTAARALPGVVAIFGPQELAAHLQPIPLSQFTPLPGFPRFLQKPLALDRTAYVGEPLALIVAESRHIAEDAADLVTVDYEPLNAVVDVREAVLDKVLVHPAIGTNVVTQFVVSKGDSDAAFAKAAYTRKESFSVHRHHAAPLETRGMVARWDEANATMRVWGTTKLPFRNREILSGMLGLPEKQVELIEVDVGGSFGVRGEFYPEDFLVPFAARALNRPIKWIEDRMEHLVATNHARQMRCDLEIAVDGNGMITGLRGDFMVDLGAYARPNGGVAPGKGMQFMCGPYRIENATFEVRCLVTNKTPFGSYRGPGRYESSYFRERIVDVAAADLGIDPAEFRMRNLIPPELLPWNAGAMVPSGPIAYYDTGDYPSVMKQALEAFRYDERAKRRGKDRDGRLHGVGVGCFVESGGGGPSEAARLVVAESGRLHLFTGSSSAGQSHETALSQILADELRFPIDQIDVFHGSTTYVERGWGSYHSRSVVMGGGAILLAVEKLRSQIGELLARRRSMADATFRWDEAGAIRDGDGLLITTFGELGKQAATDLEVRQALEAAAVYSSSELTYTFGVQLAHVAVDPETFEVELLKFLTMEDVGRMINPAVVHGQTLGASVQGISATFLDHLVYDESGQLLTGSFADYYMATSTDFPNVEAISLEQSKALNNPLGAKGAGEGGIAATGGALANAVEDALRHLGICIRDLPLSPDRLATLARQARSAKSGAQGQQPFGSLAGARAAEGAAAAAR